jgi:hypothetical protein
MGKEKRVVNSAPVSVSKDLQDEVTEFLNSRQADRMRLKGMLMMHNLLGLASLAGEIGRECQKYGFKSLVEATAKIEAAAKKSDFAACMALVSNYEEQTINLKVEYG